eukprot:11668799-Ditylum_brightwellii.AAC.1
MEGSSSWKCIRQEASNAMSWCHSYMMSWTMGVRQTRCFPFGSTACRVVRRSVLPMIAGVMLKSVPNSCCHLHLEQQYLEGGRVARRCCSFSMRSEGR